MIHIHVICGQDDDVVAERVILGVYSIGKGWDVTAVIQNTC